MHCPNKNNLVFLRELMHKQLCAPGCARWRLEMASMSYDDEADEADEAPGVRA